MDAINNKSVTEARFCVLIPSELLHEKEYRIREAPVEAQALLGFGEN
jgi:hypothetical protein